MNRELPIDKNIFDRMLHKQRLSWKRIDTDKKPIGPNPNANALRNTEPAWPQAGIRRPHPGPLPVEERAICFTLSSAFIAFEKRSFDRHVTEQVGYA
jgi:hypothetical protein